MAIGLSDTRTCLPGSDSDTGRASRGVPGLDSDSTREIGTFPESDSDTARAGRRGPAGAEYGPAQSESRDACLVGPSRLGRSQNVTKRDSVTEPASSEPDPGLHLRMGCGASQHVGLGRDTLSRRARIY